jgi:hypothetical protein
MKTRKYKKLQLNRDVLRTLEGGVLARAVGGTAISGSEHCTEACQPNSHSGQPTYCHCPYCLTQPCQ